MSFQLLAVVPEGPMKFGPLLKEILATPLCIRDILSTALHRSGFIDLFIGQLTDEEQCSNYLEYFNLLCNFAILYFDISEDKVSRMHVLLKR